MDKLILEDLLDVEYIKLHFTAELLEDAALPRQKASALRGGMGEMLLRINCIRDRHCDQCPYEPECLVRRIMYSKMRTQPEFMSAGDSVGYVICCEDRRENFEAGDTFEFSMMLFGRMAVYFGQILQAFQYLGYQGLGKEKAKFKIVRVTNSKLQNILDGQNVYMERVTTQRIADYVSYRKEKRRETPGNSAILILRTPLTIKSQGEQLSEVQAEAFFKSIVRRLYMLNCYEKSDAKAPEELESIPTLTMQSVRPVTVKRYSTTHDDRIGLEGIIGECRMENVSERNLELLYAGELVHVGKNTSFGFGRYTVKEVVE